MDTNDLKKKVKAREKFLRQVLDFVESVVRHYGRITKHETCSDHMNVDRELKDFNGFDIFWSLGRCNTIRIDYCLPSSHESPPGGRRIRVLFLRYWHTGIEGCEATFDEENNWQEAMTLTITRSEEIIAERVASRTAAEREAEETRERQEEEAKLAERAKRLGLA